MTLNWADGDKSSATANVTAHRAAMPKTLTVDADPMRNAKRARASPCASGRRGPPRDHAPSLAAVAPSPVSVHVSRRTLTAMINARLRKTLTKDAKANSRKNHRAQLVNRSFIFQIINYVQFRRMPTQMRILTMVMLVRVLCHMRWWKNVARA